MGASLGDASESTQLHYICVSNCLCCFIYQQVDGLATNLLSSICLSLRLGTEENGSTLPSCFLPCASDMNTDDQRIRIEIQVISSAIPLASDLIIPSTGPRKFVPHNLLICTSCSNDRSPCCLI